MRMKKMNELRFDSHAVSDGMSYDAESDWESMGLQHKDTTRFEYLRKALDKYDYRNSLMMIMDYSGKGRVTFNKGCLRAIKNPRYVQCVLDENTLTFAVSGICAEAARMMKNAAKRKLNGSVELKKSGAFLKKLDHIMCWNPAQKRMFLGKVENGILFFDLKEIAAYVPDWSKR